jgi:ABC-type dipeptide/oligopeptide/nickel transport system permease component
LGRYIIRRILGMIPLLLIISFFVFFLGQYGAQDLALSLTLKVNDNSFDAEMYQDFKEQMNLDLPPLKRYTKFIANATKGDFGVSYILPGTPSIGLMIKKALPISIQLALISLFWVIILGITFGIIAAVTRNSPIDHGIVGITTILSSIPGFVLAPIALVLLVTKWNVFSSVGFGWHGMFAKETLLPSLCLAAGPLLGVVRYTRSSVINTLSNEYIRAARARGLDWFTVVTKHVIKNSLIPVVTILGLSTARMLAGSMFIETVFSIPGFGNVAVKSFQGGDIQTVAATTLVSAMIVMSMNLLVDILYGFLDPRVRISE